MVSASILVYHKTFFPKQPEWIFKTINWFCHTHTYTHTSHIIYLNPFNGCPQLWEWNTNFSLEPFLLASYATHPHSLSYSFFSALEFCTHLLCTCPRIRLTWLSLWLTVASAKRPPQKHFLRPIHIKWLSLATLLLIRPGWTNFAVLPQAQAAKCILLVFIDFSSNYVVLESQPAFTQWLEYESQQLSAENMASLIFFRGVVSLVGSLYKRTLQHDSEEEVEDH